MYKFSNNKRKRAYSGIDVNASWLLCDFLCDLQLGVISNE